MNGDTRFAAAVEMLGPVLARILCAAPERLQKQATEIRLRQGRAICIMCGVQPTFLSAHGTCLDTPQGEGVTEKELQEAFIALCGWAVHAHQKELCEGFIAVRGGHRAGLGATAVVQDGRVGAVRNITSINLRIAREMHGVADTLIARCFRTRPRGLLLAGEPASGKTTMLRDLARQLAGAACGYQKVCVVDESGEIGGAAAGAYANDLGVTSDLLFGYPKAHGLQAALRYLSPQIIICDEICTEAEIAAVAAAANSGVAVITSVHGGSVEELRRKAQLHVLLERGAFSHFALLEGAARPCTLAHIGEAAELCSC